MRLSESKFTSKFDYVTVQVPTPCLEAVYRLLADIHSAAPAPVKRGGSGTGGGGALPAPLAPPPHSSGAVDGWDLQTLQRMVNESPPAMRCILRALALVEQDDQWLPIAKLEASLEHRSETTKHTIPGTLGAFGRRVKNRYGWQLWPFEVRRGSKQVRWEYWMPPSLRPFILEYLAQASPDR